MTDASPRVRLLDPHTVNQIAAGEVVERPASVVKELVENALDAGATRIEIELKASGRTLIRVSDNGCGMSTEDARSSLQRHATSKITSVEDLNSVATMGFRGEALPSIASVSRMTLTSSNDDSGARTQLRIDGSQVIEDTKVAGPRGTEIVVEDLFYNTPARLKFLKSDTTELGACLEAISKCAIARPEIAFTFIHNGQTALQTTGNGSRLEAIAETWSRDMARSLAEVDSEGAGIRVSGYISPPHVTRPNRVYQYIYVNGRPVRTRTLTAALDQAYREITPERRFPILVLMLEVDPSRVDVNVSPTKSEVRFQQEGAAFEAIRIAIKNALLEHGMMPSAASVATANQALQSSPGFSPRPLSWEAQRPLSIPDPFQQPLESMTVPLPMSGLEAPVHVEKDAKRPFAHLARNLRVLGQAMNTFIVAEADGGIVIIDQHVAHERILYEYLCGLKGPTAIEKQPLLVPVTAHLDKRSALLLGERLDEIREIGFDLEPFGGDSFVIRAVPAALRGKDPIKTLSDLADELVESSLTHKLVPTREQIWIMSSCKMAVKSGDPLSIAEMEKLIIDLAETENPYLCPHGRPITVTLSQDELFRKFKR